MKMFKIFFASDNNRDSMFFTAWPLVIVLRLVSVFYLEFSSAIALYRLNFVHVRNLPGWILLCFSLIHLIIQCNNYVTCTVQVILNLSFIPLCLITERNMRDMINTVELVDRELKELGHPKLISSTKKTATLTGFMILHMLSIAFLMYEGKSYSTTSIGILFSIFYMAIQRRLTFVSFKFFCDEVGQRFRYVECCWVRAQSSKNVERMEQVRLLYHKVRSAVDCLSKAFGLRLLHMIVDISIQCTRFFIFTFMFKVETNHLFFVSFMIYQYYCLHSSVTASENLTIRSRSVLKHLISPPWYKMPERERIQVELLWTNIEDFPVEVMVCGLFAYNRSLILTWGTGMVTLWALIIQTSPVISQVIFYFDQVTQP